MKNLTWTKNGDEYVSGWFRIVRSGRQWHMAGETYMVTGTLAECKAEAEAIYARRVRKARSAWTPGDQIAY